MPVASPFAPEPTAFQTRVLTTHLGIDPGVAAFVERLAAETGRSTLDILRGTRLLDDERLLAAIADALGLGHLDAATVALLDRLAPRWEGPVALAMLEETAPGPGLVIGLGLEPENAGLAARLAARRGDLAPVLRLMAADRARRLAVWDLGPVPLEALRAVAATGGGLDELSRLATTGADALYRLIARRYGLRHETLDEPGWRIEGAGRLSVDVARRATIALAVDPGGERVVIAAPPLGRIEADLHRLFVDRARREEVVLAAPAALRRLFREALAGPTLERATEGLFRASPELSARQMPSRTGRVVLAGLLLAGAVITALWPAVTIDVGLVAAMIGFLGVGLLRAMAAFSLRWRRPTPPVPPKRLPAYSVLVALYDEAAMIPGLVAELRRLRYPADRLDVKLVVEEKDVATRRAIDAAIAGQGGFEMIVVPPGEPRTKPRALAYALAFCRGDLVAVFDAEDRPAPDQLLKAAAAFDEGPPDLGCVQARLVVDRVETLLQAQFAIEYAALFDGLLPFLADRRLPLPLGGTSNHFKRIAIESAGGWDPWNVTEDADLGIRLARCGWRSATLDSVTLEEAPRGLRDWRRQRTRWIKGWLVTWLVHMRRPHRLLADVGLPGFLAIQLYLGGILLSSLAHPVGLVLVGLHAADVVPIRLGEHFLTDLVLATALLDMAFGYGATLWLAGRALALRRRFALANHIPLMPAYWLLVSLAAWLAIFQVIARPHYWAKTPHVPHDRPKTGGVAAGSEPGDRRGQWKARLAALAARLRRRWTG